MRQAFDAVIQRRIVVILLFFFVVCAVLVGRLFMLQIVYHNEYSVLASKQQRRVQEILSERGALYATDKGGILVPLALNRTAMTVAASPKQIEDPEKTAVFLSQTLGVDENELLGKLKGTDDPYEILVKGVSLETAEKARQLRLPGIFFEEEKRRVYPHDDFASHLIGFVSKETDIEEGRYGLERFYERDLSGERGFFEGVKDASGFWIALGKRIIRPSQDGSDLLLSVDYNIQLKAEEVLVGIAKRWGAESASVVVLEPATGRVLALASRPSFDPNQYASVKNFSIFLNPIVEAIYELGSVLKPIIMAAALEERMVTPETTYYDTGQLKRAGYTIKNFDGKAYKTQTMTQVLEKSLNTGAVYVAELLGQDRHSSYLRKFGFGKKTGIDLPGEVSGDLLNLDAGRPIDFATASFGQGIAVTPIQIIAAFAAIANKGTLMKPHVIDTIIDSSGNRFTQNPEVVERVVSPETAETLTKMLVSVVRSGFENRAGVKGYFVAGKTGTAQIPRSDARGYTDEVIHTFVGYAPAFDARFLIYFQLNKPKGNRFAANTLTPAFHDLAEYILNYYQVSPDEH